jgi:hypothetical protein
VVDRFSVPTKSKNFTVGRFLFLRSQKIHGGEEVSMSGFERLDVVASTAREQVRLKASGMGITGTAHALCNAIS